MITIHAGSDYCPKGWPRLYYTIVKYARKLDKFLALWLLVVLMTGLAMGQIQPPYQIRAVASAPSGSCPNALFFQYDYVTNTLYGCQGTLGSLTWAALTGGGGGGVASINGTAGAFTFTGAGVSCTGTTCTFSSSSGVTSITGDGTIISNAASTGAVTLTLETAAAHAVLIGPTSGSAASPTYRLIAGADLPNPSATTLGGVESLAAASHNFLTSISTSGVPAQAQPAFTDISGTATAAQLPNPTLTSIGGVEAIAAVSHEWINAINTSGVPQLTQPAFGDLSGSATCAQLPALTGDVTTTAGSCATTVVDVNGAVVPTTAKLLGSNSSKQLIAAALTSAHLYVGNASNLPVDVAISGDVAITNAGVTTVATVNGVAYGTSPSTNTVPVVTGTNAITYEAVPNAALANSAVTITAGTGLSSGGSVSLGSSITPAVSLNTRSRAVGAGFDGSGSALTSGKVVYFSVPFACTISAWDIAVDAGTITFDVWKISTGTAIPTVTNTITASALPALSTGTNLHSTTLTGWTTTVTANDIFGIDINTVATATKATLILECDTSS